jgi:hypothetical protein
MPSPIVAGPTCSQMRWFDAICSRITRTNSVINITLAKNVTHRGVYKVALFPTLSSHTVNNWSRYVHTVIMGGTWISRAG